MKTLLAALLLIPFAAQAETLDSADFMFEGNGPGICKKKFGFKGLSLDRSLQVYRAAG